MAEPTDKFLTQKRLHDAWLALYDLKQATYMGTSDRIDLRKAMDVLSKFHKDPRIPEERVDL